MPNHLPPLIGGMIAGGLRAVDELREQITDVRLGSCADGQDRITFTLNGKPMAGILRGRNRDLMLTGNPDSDTSVALRCFLDGDIE